MNLDSLIPNDDTLACLRDTISSFHSLHIPVQFIFIYDEAWILFMRLHNIISAIVGSDYQRLPDFWSWRIDPAISDSGWGLHRDKSVEFLRDRLIDPDSGLPRSLTVWIALTDANPMNSCMHVLPADRDPCYETMCDIKNHSWSLSELFQNFRALPVTTGSVLMWNQVFIGGVVWGGRIQEKWY